MTGLNNMVGKPSHWAAAVSMMIVSWGSAVVIIFQAAQALDATEAQTASWLTIIALSSGVLSMALSWRYQTPIYIAWSTPGAAMIALTTDIALSDAIGAMIFAGLLNVVLGVSGLFAWMVKHIPASIASAMLAGILIGFGTNVFVSMQTDLILVALMLFAFLISKAYAPKYSLLWMLALGCVYAYCSGHFTVDAVQWQWPALQWIDPTFNWQTIISLGIPLFLVTLSTQYIPGVAVLHAHGYRPPVSPIIGSTGLATVLLAPFGLFMSNLAAISAAICMGNDVDERPEKRYQAVMIHGVLSLGLAAMGAMVVVVFGALPKALLVTLAGMAILGTLTDNLVTAMSDARVRDAAILTLLASASGIQLFGISSAFWGLLIGMSVYHFNIRVALKK